MHMTPTLGPKEYLYFGLFRVPGLVCFGPLAMVSLGSAAGLRDAQGRLNEGIHGSTGRGWGLPSQSLPSI